MALFKHYYDSGGPQRIKCDEGCQQDLAAFLEARENLRKACDSPLF